MRKTALALVFFCLLVSGCGNLEEELRAEIESEKQINAALSSKNSTLKKTISYKSEEINRLNSEVIALQDGLAEAKQKYSELLDKCDIFDARKEKKGDGGIFDRVFD